MWFSRKLPFFPEILWNSQPQTCFWCKSIVGSELFPCKSLCSECWNRTWIVWLHSMFFEAINSIGTSWASTGSCAFFPKFHWLGVWQWKMLGWISGGPAARDASTMSMWVKFGKNAATFACPFADDLYNQPSLWYTLIYIYTIYLYILWSLRIRND